MDSVKDNYCFDSSSLNETKQVNDINNSRFVSDTKEAHEMSAIGQFNANSQINHLFKVPNLDKLPLKKANVKNIKSPSRKVQAGRIRSDLKASQQRLSLIPRPSFINSSKSLHCSRSSQQNARKELIKKMVFLAECTLKENRLNQNTPVKSLAGLTPKKTPRSGSYFMLPEFSKKLPKLEEIRSPIEGFIKKEMYSYSLKPTNQKTPQKPCESKTCHSNPKTKEGNTLDVQGLSETKTKLKQVLGHCKLYSKKVTSVHETIRNLDEAFESKLNQIPEYKVYNEFCLYQLKKEDLYKDLRTIEEDFRNSITTKMNVSCKLKTFLQKKGKCFEKQESLLKDFEQVIQTTLEKYNEVNTETGNTEDKVNEETPKLRRSLRLSKVSKMNEKTPMTKRLKKLDNKSKGIQKTGRF